MAVVDGPGPTRTPVDPPPGRETIGDPVLATNKKNKTAATFFRLKWKAGFLRSGGIWKDAR